MYELSLTTSHVPAQSDMETRDITIGALLREVAAARPDAEALVEIRQDGSEGRRWTYAELLADAEQLAHALSNRFAPGERVVIWSPNSPEWVLMECACALSGLVLVTANPAFQARELAYVLEQSGAVALFLVEEFRGNPMARIGAEVAASIPPVREVTDMESAVLYAEGPRPRALPDVAPGDAAMIQYTSGTTGFPKGAVLSHRGLVNNTRGYVIVTGRVKEMIIRGGENHLPAKIENCLLEHASVAEVAVVGLPDLRWGEVIGAFIRSTGPLDRSALHAHCRANVSPQKTPTVWVQVEHFP